MGKAVDYSLECQPFIDVAGAEVVRLDFGFVALGATAVRAAACMNHGKTEVTMNRVGITQPPIDGAPFAIASVERSFALPAGGAPVAIAVSFSPAELGDQNGRLDFTTDDPNQPFDHFELVGTGGGPAIGVEPSWLDFATVAVDSYQSREIVITNVGTDVAGSARDNLLLAKMQGDSWTEKRAEIAGPDATAFSVMWPPDFYPMNGLSEGESARLRIRFAPTSAGLKTATLTIDSNDPSAPTVEVPVSGLALKLPPCDFDIKPPTLDFGSVESNNYLTLSFAIMNRDRDVTHEYRVSMLDLTRGTYHGGAFALVNGPLESAIIKGGENLNVPVRFQPKADGAYGGEVEFFISSPTRPDVKVALSGIAQPACLMIAPRELDFGTIGINCNSRQRIFTMRNTCSRSTTVTAIDLQQGPSNEFAVTKKPALPVTIAGGASSVVEVSYHPVDPGEDTATAAVTISGNVTAYVVSLTGSAATDATCQ